MPNGEQAENVITLVGRIIAGICIIIVASVIVWLCSSTVDYGERLTILETNTQHVQSEMCEIKGLLRELTEDQQTVKELLVAYIAEHKNGSLSKKD